MLYLSFLPDIVFLRGVALRNVGENGGIEVSELQENSANYGEEFQPQLSVKVIKKDGSLEAFNVQKVVDAVGKSAYRALTKLRMRKRDIFASMWLIR